MGRAIRVDHVAEYKVPKEHEKQDEETIRLQNEGCAPKAQIPEEAIKKEKNDRDRMVREGTAFDGTFDDGFRLPMRLPIGNKVKTEVKEEIKAEKEDEFKRAIRLKLKKEKKMKKEKKEKKKKSRRRSSSSD